jgi:ankyrin repeat protein
MKFDVRRFLPIHYAVIKDHTDLLRHFYHNKKLKIFDPVYFCNEHTLLTLAIQNGAYNTVKLLVTEYGADVTEKDKQEFTYLHVAAVSGHVNIFLFFLSK